MNTTGDITATCVVAPLPGLVPRLLLQDAAPESLDAYLAGAGYQDAPGVPELDAGGLLDAVAQSGLRGRGGAAFPFAVKARAVARRGQPGQAQAPVVVANGEEGE